MEAFRLERLMVAGLGLALALVVGLQVAAFIQASFGQVAAVLEVGGKQEVKR